MKFSGVVNQTRALLHSKGRITYRALKREFDLDDEALEDLKEKLIEAEMNRWINPKMNQWRNESMPQSTWRDVWQRTDKPRGL